MQSRRRHEHRCHAVGTDAAGGELMQKRTNMWDRA